MNGPGEIEPDNCINEVLPDTINILCMLSVAAIYFFLLSGQIILIIM